jgi:threonine synthase
MSQYIGYKCSICGKEFAPASIMYTCPHCDGNLDVVLDYKSIQSRYQVEDITTRTDFSLWRYLPLLPVNDPGGEGTTLRCAGWTPLYTPPALMKKLGMEHLWIKDEGKNPTASFKDRASSVVVARAREIGADIVVTASTGNAGAALAGMSAAIGQKAIIFAPKTAPQAKIAQLLIYGAQVILVDGNYDSAFDLTIEASREFGWYCRNTGFNPFTAEGKKTAALEIWEQICLNLPDDSLPLNVFVSVGDGNIISGLHKGFKDLMTLGWLKQMPRIFGVQSEKSAAVANTFFAGDEKIITIEATTIADSISVDLPRDGVRAVRAARETGGSYITVSDEEIIAGIGELGPYGIFVEPAGSTSYMGMKKALANKQIDPHEPTVVINTGNGLKDIRAAMMAVKEAPVIEPTMTSLKKYLNQ